MPEDNAQTPEQQVPPVQQAPAAPPAPPAEDWKKRFDGAVLKIQELTQQVRDLTAQLELKSSENEQLKAQLSTKDVEKTVAVGERDKQLQEALQAKSALETEVNRLKALELKLKVIKDINQPALLKIVERIPDLTDEETLKTVMKDFADFAQEAASQREKQILAGVTPGVGPAPVASAPATEKAWEDKINSLPLGSVERVKALNDYGDWLEHKHSQ